MILGAECRRRWGANLREPAPVLLRATLLLAGFVPDEAGAGGGAAVPAEPAAALSGR